GVDFNGHAVAGATASLFSNGGTDFTVGSVAPSPASGSGTGSGSSTAPSPTPAPAPTPAPTGDGTTAHAQPVEAHTYVAADSSGVAHGSAGADDIFATGPNEALIG